MSESLDLPLNKSSRHYRELVSALDRVDRGELKISTVIGTYIVPEIHICTSGGREVFGFFLHNTSLASQIIKNVIRKVIATVDTGLMTGDELAEWDKCKGLFEKDLIARHATRPLHQYEGTFICAILALLLAPNSLSPHYYGHINNPKTAFGKKFMNEFKSLYIEENLEHIFETAI